MNHARLPSPTVQRAADGAIAWEALPSLSHLVGRSGARHEAPTWEETRPADLDALAAVEPFHEALEGLAVREFDEPEIFRALFGDGRGA
jgi:hypothetical protein